MAFFDDKKLLLSHLRHSFVTCDDTGMCELIMINEDVEQEIENDNTFQKKSMRMQQRYKQAERRTHGNLATSYDIQASPTLSRRPPLKNNANMFQAMEEKKKKGSQVKSIPWQITPLELVDRSLFSPQPIKPRPSEPSPLTRLLSEQAKKTSNPFYRYSKFNGEHHGSAASNKYCIFLAMVKDPMDPVKVTVLHTATIEDLIGVTFWKYYEEKREPFNIKSLQHYSVMIADDDGEIDIDLPELQKDDFISKFGFRYLGIVERSGHLIQDSGDCNIEKYKIVKVYYEHGGFSTFALNDLEIEMSEVLARVIRKRRLQIHGYELERKDNPGVFINLKSLLSSQGTLDFMLVRNTRQGQPTSSNSDSDGVDSPADVKTQVTSHQYKSYEVVLLHKMRSNTKVQLGIDSQRIEIQPIETPSRGFLNKPIKPANYDITDICTIEILDERSNGNSVFRITRASKEGIKNMDFEGPSAVTKEIVAKVTLILGDIPSSIRSEYAEKKEKRRGSSKMDQQK